MGHRIRDVEEGPDGSLWMLEDANPGALLHMTPKLSRRVSARSFTGSLRLLY